MKAYLDESGIHDGAEVCVVAGYWGKKGPWRQFEKHWRVILRNFEVPLDKFHAKDAVNKTGFFLKWDRDKATRFLRELGGVVASYKVHPVCWGIFRSDFFSLSNSERRFLTGATWHPGEQKFLSTGSPGKPYFVCFTECVRRVTSYTPAAGRVDFFFGCDRPAGEHAAQLFRYWRWRAKAKRLVGSPFYSRSSPQKFGAIAFPWAKETPALQVADLLAYLTYRFMLEKKDRPSFEVVPDEPLLSLLRNRKHPDDTGWRDAPLLRQIIHSEVPNFPPE